MSMMSLDKTKNKDYVSIVHLWVLRDSEWLNNILKEFNDFFAIGLGLALNDITNCLGLLQCRRHKLMRIDTCNSTGS